jgi:hypothetical protein
VLEQYLRQGEIIAAEIARKQAIKSKYQEAIFGHELTFANNENLGSVALLEG